MESLSRTGARPHGLWAAGADVPVKLPGTDFSSFDTARFSWYSVQAGRYS